MREPHCPTLVRDNHQFENGDIGEFDLVILDLACCLRRTEVPLLSHNFETSFPPSENQRNTNSWVRSAPVSSNASQMRLIRCGTSKTSRTVWVPKSAARQPSVSPEIRADSTGYPFSSEVTSTTAADSRSSHSSFGAGVSCGVGVMRRFRIAAGLPLILLSRSAAETS